MRRLALMLAIAGDLTLLAIAQSEAQKSKSTGFFFGGGFEAASLKVDASNAATESGGGLDLLAGYGFNPHWSVFAQASGAVIDAAGGGNYTLGHFDFAARVHFRAGPNIVVPFVQFGLTGRGTSRNAGDETVTENGGGLSFGGGLNAHFTPKVAFSTALLWTVGQFDEYQVNGTTFPSGSVDATTARFHVGLVFFP